MYDLSSLGITRTRPRLCIFGDFPIQCDRLKGGVAGAATQPLDITAEVTLIDQTPSYLPMQLEIIFSTLVYPSKTYIFPVSEILNV